MKSSETPPTIIDQHAQRMQCNLQPLQEYVCRKYNQQDDEGTLVEIDQESEDQIPNNFSGEEVHVNNNGE